MATLIVVTIHDAALGAFMRPWFAQSAGQARRMFGDEVARPESDLHKHPADYSLYQIGTFDDDSAELKPTVRVALAKGSDYVSQ